MGATGAGAWWTALAAGNTNGAMGATGAGATVRGAATGAGATVRGAATGAGATARGAATGAGAAIKGVATGTGTAWPTGSTKPSWLTSSENPSREMGLRPRSVETRSPKAAVRGPATGP